MSNLEYYSCQYPNLTNLIVCVDNRKESNIHHQLIQQIKHISGFVKYTTINDYIYVIYDKLSTKYTNKTQHINCIHLPNKKKTKH